MLAEVAAANAAFAVIKTALANGAELHAIGKQLTDFFDAKAQIERKAQDKGKGTEDFFAREQLRQQEEEFLQALIYQGRPGLVEEWWKYQAQRKKERDAEAKAIRANIARRREVIYNWFMGILVTLAGLTGIGLIGLVAWIVLRGES